MKIKIFDVRNILAFKKKWEAFYKNNNIEISKVKIECLKDYKELIVFYREAKSNKQELIVLKESKTVIEKKVNKVLESRDIDCLDIALRDNNSFMAIIVVKVEE